MLWWTLIQLKSKNPETRCNAAARLSDSRDPRAFGALVTLLKDPYTNVREKAIRVLGNTEDRRAVEPLVSALKDPYYKNRSAALHALERFEWQPLDDSQRAMRAAVQGNWQAISGKTYDWEEVDLSVDALEALGVIVCDSHDPSKEKALQILLRSRDRKVIKILLTAVGGLGWHLFGALKKIDPNWAEAEEARSAVPDLLFALKHGDPRYGGSAAARALGKIGDPRAVQPLCEALTTRGEWDTVRKLHLEAVCALGSIGDAKAVEPLVAAIRSQIDGAWGHEAAAETGCAWEAILALGEIGGPSADSLRVIEFPKTIAGRQLRAVADKTLAAMEANRSGPE